MLNRRGKPFLMVALATWALGCRSVAPPPPAEETLEAALPAETEIPDEFASSREAPVDTGAVDDGWIASFGEARLEALVDEALANNRNLVVAAAQVERSAATARLAGSALKPTVSLGADLSETSGDTPVSGTAYSGGIGISWEADVWGRVRSGARAAEEALEASLADFEYARQSLAAQTARSFFLATELRLQVALARQTVDIFSRLLELVETKQSVGQVAMQDVHLARADLASAEEALRQAEGGYQQALRSLEVLLGRYPAGDVETAEELTPVPPPIPVGLPSEILERRPDLQAAERQVRAAFYLTEEARLARLPRFTLNAGVGGSSDLTSAIGSLGAGLFAPLYAGGAIAAQIESANADQKAAIAIYGQAVLRAFEEVETALTNERLFEERQRYLESVVQENERAAELAEDRYEVGQIDLLSLLQIQARVVGARVGLVRIKNERLTQRVNLHLSLGGSFEAGEAE